MTTLFVSTIELLATYTASTAQIGSINMGQLRKLVVPVADGSGVPQPNVPVRVLRNGARVSRDIGSGFVGVEHPGSLRKNDVCFVTRGGVELSNLTVTLVDDAVWDSGAGDWKAAYSASAAWSPTFGDRLVLRGVTSSDYVRVFDSDLRTGTSTTAELTTDSSGILQKWVDAKDVDIRVANGSSIFYLLDVATDSRNVVSPEDFGAQGDGVSDDTVAIQRALDFASEISGGADVDFAAKSYFTTGNTATSDNVRLIGFGIPNNIVGGKPRVLYGTGTPEGVVTAPIGSTFQRSDGSHQFYKKVSGTGSAGWLSDTREYLLVNLTANSVSSQQTSSGFVPLGGSWSQVGSNGDFAVSAQTAKYTGERSSGIMSAVFTFTVDAAATVEFALFKDVASTPVQVVASGQVLASSASTPYRAQIIAPLDGTDWDLRAKVTAGSNITLTVTNMNANFEMVK